MTYLPDLLKIFIPFAIIFQLLPLMIWLERKGSAFIQDRPGPNRANIQGIRLGGIIHSIADVLKLLFKEDITPNHVNKFFYVLAPFMALSFACLTFMVIPYADTITLNGQAFSFMAADVNAGVLFILAISSMGVYGVMLAGWSSNNKYSLLGGLRSSAQMISYELSMGLAVMAVILWSGSLSMQSMVAEQTSTIWHWNFVREPLACLIFIVAAFAETNRAPFDLPESESELVAGFHTEYSSIKFAMFFMAEYVHMIVASAIIVTLFFGGYQLPFLSSQTITDNANSFLYYGLFGFAIVTLLIGVLLSLKFKKGNFGDKRDYEVLVFGVPAVVVGMFLFVGLILNGQLALSPEQSQWVTVGLQVLTLITKTLIMCWVFIWVRWTLPRIRYDHLMNLGWKIMLPLAMLNVVITALRIAYF